MDKARLPAIPPILKDRTYKPSGKVSFLRFILVIIVGIVIAPIITIIGFFAANFLLGVIVALVNLATRVRVSAIILGGLILFTSAIWVGLLIGLMLSSMLRFAKCRSPFWAAIASLIIIAVVFGVMLTPQGRTLAIIPLVAPGFFGWLGAELSVRTMLGGIQIPFDYYYSWVDALYAVEWFIAVMLVSVGASMTPFCEHCKRWYKAKTSIKLPIANAPQLLDSLTDRTLHLSSDDIYPLTNYPHLNVELHYCDNCNVSDVELTAQIVEEGSKDKPKIDHWFNTLVKAKRANVLLRTLFKKERPTA